MQYFKLFCMATALAISVNAAKAESIIYCTSGEDLTGQSDGSRLIYPKDPSASTECTDLVMTGTKSSFNSSTLSLNHFNPTSYKGSDFSSANLHNAIMSSYYDPGKQVDYTNTKFDNTNLSGMNASYSNFSGVDFSTAYFYSNTYSTKEGNYTDTSCSDESQVDLYHSKNSSQFQSNTEYVQVPVFTYANLSNAVFGSSNPNESQSCLTYGAFAFADLSGANLEYLKSKYANFVGANLSNANMSNMSASTSIFYTMTDGYTPYDEANLDGANLDDSNFSSADMTQAMVLNVASCENTDFPHDHSCGQDVKIHCPCGTSDKDSSGSCLAKGSTYMYYNGDGGYCSQGTYTY